MAIFHRRDPHMHGKLIGNLFCLVVVVLWD